VPASGTCLKNGVCTPRMRVREQLVYLGELCGRTSSEVSRVTDLWLEPLG
jgi:ABC-2 type transport system ATP-binding protein